MCAIKGIGLTQVELRLLDLARTKIGHAPISKEGMKKRVAGNHFQCLGPNLCFFSKTPHFRKNQSLHLKEFNGFGKALNACIQQTKSFLKIVQGYEVGYVQHQIFRFHLALVKKKLKGLRAFFITSFFLKFLGLFIQGLFLRRTLRPHKPGKNKAKQNKDNAIHKEIVLFKININRSRWSLGVLGPGSKGGAVLRILPLLRCVAPKGTRKAWLAGSPEGSGASSAGLRGPWVRRPLHRAGGPSFEASVTKVILQTMRDA